MQIRSQKKPATNIVQYESREERNLWYYFSLQKSPSIRKQLFNYYKALCEKELRIYIKRFGLSYIQDADRDELRSECYLALLECVDAYNKSFGVKFEVYARRRLRGSFIDWLRRSDNFPRIVAKLRSKANRLRATYASKYGHQPNDQQLIDEFGEEARECLCDSLADTSVKAISGLKDKSADSTDDSVLTLSTSSQRSAAVTDKTRGSFDLVKAVGEIVTDKCEYAAVILYYINGYNNARIARLYNRSISTVIEWRRRGLQRLYEHKDIFAHDMGLDHN